MSGNMYALWIMLAYMALYIVRVVKGPTIWDRLLGLNLISTKILLIIILFASMQNTEYLLDLAIVFALLGFIGTVFTARFISEWQKGGRGK